MTDRELLERAAKAAGYDKTMQPVALCDTTGSWTSYAKHVYWIDGKECRDYWNPLTDDGDALRLAVKLRMSVDPWGSGAAAVVFIANRARVAEPHYGDDPERATRRAIVRAAAELCGPSQV